MTCDCERHPTDDYAYVFKDSCRQKLNNYLKSQLESINTDIDNEWKAQFSALYIDPIDTMIADISSIPDEIFGGMLYIVSTSMVYRYEYSHFPTHL